MNHSGMTTRSVRMRLKSPSAMGLVMLGAFGAAAPAWSAQLLGSAAGFAVLGSSTVTNIPTSTIVGNVGVWSSGGANALTGFNSSPGVAVPDLQVSSGLVHAGTAVAQLAQGDLTGALGSLGLLGPGTLLSADLVGQILLPGVYTVPAGTTNLSGAVTLDGGGNANAGWVFLMESSLITSPDSTVNVINTGIGAGVYWAVRSSATLDTNTAFLGNILAFSSITMNAGASIGCGSALASGGAVTLSSNVIGGGCGAVGKSEGLAGGLSVEANGGVPTVLPIASAVPLPAALPLLAAGLAGLGFRRRQQR